MMVSKKSIGIIGAGLFGCHISIHLQKLGMKTTIFEKEKSVLYKTSRNNSRRVHLGFHYPRHLETAKQSLKSAVRFLELYGDCTIEDFENFYAVAATSKVSIASYESFLDKLEAPYSKYKSQDAIIHGLKKDRIQAFYRVPEPILDVEILSERLLSEMDEARVELCLEEEVKAIQHIKQRWRVTTTNRIEYFDYLILATHSQETFPISYLGEKIVSLQESEFHITNTLLVKIPNMSTSGITIIDGDFLTFLPVNMHNEFSIYAPSLSRVSVQVANSNPFAQLKLSDSLLKESTEGLISRFYEWFSDEVEIELKQNWIALRTIPANKEITDERVSNFEEMAPNLFKIHSTKLVHCVDIATQISDRLFPEALTLK